MRLDPAQSFAKWAMGEVESLPGTVSLCESGRGCAHSRMGEFVFKEN